ncbi:MAG: DUF2244 domain-containing protein [Proteobacteria bacterium]|nr:DUF2244 domain-containing protein [Pseudomonadota bacterium]
METPRLYLDMTIRARRSLSRKGVMLIMIPVAFVNLVFASFFVLIGGAFVPPFLGLDVIGLAIAFWLSFRATDRAERVRVSADEIKVTRERPGAVDTVWTSAPAFTRVELDHPGRHASRLRLSSKGKGLTLASAVSPGEREQVAQALEDAVRAARAERW